MSSEIEKMLTFSPICVLLLLSKLISTETINSSTFESNQRMFLNFSNKRGVDENVPNFRPTGFHDFISSNQGPSYHYDVDTNVVGLSTVRNNEARERSAMQDFYHFHSFNSPGNRMLLPENRLPTEVIDKPRVPTPQYLPKQKQVQQATYKNIINSKENYEAMKQDATEDMYASSDQPHRNSRTSNMNRHSADYFRNWMDSGISTVGKHSTSVMSPMERYAWASTLQNVAEKMDYPIMMEHKGIDLFELITDSLPVVIAVVIPLSLILMSVMPLLAGNLLTKNANLPFVTTTATGKWTGNSSSQFLSPLLDVIGTFTPRTDRTFTHVTNRKFIPINETECIQKVFCEVMKNKGKAPMPLRLALQDFSTFLEYFRLDEFGLKSMLNALEGKECELIECTEEKMFAMEKNMP
ncbi:hypothetical protein JTE90_015144 [Oedothorax gibbosus]|uniref:Uncharacterized protein n=1 Tax=Oedothorax gibbosus TaxID=931172 RepID=A0AAV6VQC7_9ARAC|nr:hypothetical protein JTE90_015144 [Oedothorax gibbosus]